MTPKESGDPPDFSLQEFAMEIRAGIYVFHRINYHNFCDPFTSYIDPASSGEFLNFFNALVNGKETTN